MKKRPAPNPRANVEWELGPDGKRTGRWRRRQFYAAPGVEDDRRKPSERAQCEWRGPEVQP